MMAHGTNGQQKKRSSRSDTVAGPVQEVAVAQRVERPGPFSPRATPRYPAWTRSSPPRPAPHREVGTRDVALCLADGPRRASLLTHASDTRPSPLVFRTAMAESKVTSIKILK